MRLRGRTDIKHWRSRYFRTEGLWREGIVRGKNKKGKELSGELDVLRLQIESGGPAEKGREEEDLKHALREILLYNISDLAYVCDDKGNILYLNHAFERLSGYEPEAFINKPFAPLFSGDDLTKAIDGYTRTLKGESPVFELRFKKTGTLCSYNNTPFRDRDGKIIGVLGIARDITEQRRAKQALLLSQHKYKSLFKNMLTAAAYHQIILDKKGKPVDYIILEVNDAFERQTGLKKENVIGQRVTELMPGIKRSKPDLISIYGKVALTGEGISLEFYFEPLDRWYSVSAYCPEKGFFVSVFQDVSDKKRSEDELAHAREDLESKVEERTAELTRSNELLSASEAHHRTLVETIPYGIMENDLSGAITFCNAACAGMHGYAEDEMDGKSFWDFYDTKEEREESRRRFYEIVREQPPPAPHFHKTRTKDGRVMDIRVDWNYKHDEKGGLTGFISIISDITDQKRAEEEAANTLRYTRALTEVNKALEEHHDLDKMLTSTLEKILSIFNADRAWLMHPVDVTARSLKLPYQVTTPGYPVEGALEVPIDGDENVISICKQTLASKEPIASNFDEAELPADGMLAGIIRKFQIRSQMVIAILPRVGEPWMLGLHQCSYAREWGAEDKKLFKDISSRVTDAVTGALLHKDLEASEEKFRSIFESANDAIMLLDEKGFFDCNAATIKILGCSSKDEILGSHPSDWSPPVQGDGRSSLEAAQEHIETAFREGRDFFEWAHLRANGETFPAEVLLTAMRLEGRDVLQATVRDITERKTVIEEKEHLQAQLIQAQKMEAIGTLAGGIAHDFNNILTVIKNLTSLALDKASKDPHCTCYLEPIRDVSERGINLVQQLLIFSQNKPVEFSRFNLNDVIDDFLKIIGTIVSEDILLEKELEGGLPDIRADRGRIEQVITNLVINSRDSMLMGGVITLRTENVMLTTEQAASIQGAVPGDFVCLTVQDTGAGMDRETINHIFEPFFTTKSPNGTGLGLSVVYGIVKELNGWINVESEVRKGTKFMVYLPVARGVDRDTHEERTERKTFDGKGRHILLVEDDKWVRKSTAMVLNVNNYVVFEASSAEQAINLFFKEKGKFDLVMIDVVMPGRNGLQLVGPLLDVNPKIPILLCSGHLDDKAQLEQIIRRGLPYIQKPYEIDELLQAVEEVIAESS